MKRLHLALFSLLLPISLTACQHEWYPFLYRPTVSQGNIIDSKSFAQLRLGMNSAEVVNLVGEPILQTPLSANTWSYVYMLRAKGHTLQHQQVILQFNHDKLIAIK